MTLNQKHKQSLYKADSLQIKLLFQCDRQIIKLTTMREKPAFFITSPDQREFNTRYDLYEMKKQNLSLKISISINCIFHHIIY